MPFYVNVYQVLMGINKAKSPIINVSKAPCLLELDCPKRCKLSKYSEHLRVACGIFKKINYSHSKARNLTCLRDYIQVVTSGFQKLFHCFKLF